MDINSIQINFDQDKLLVLNICLAFLMFGVALDIRLSDFSDIFKRPKAPVTGLISQLLGLPILTLLLIYLLQPPASLALGMLLVASCPGGNVSNFAVHLAKANAALSVMLTSITTLGAIIITPVSFVFWSSWIPDLAPMLKTITVEPSSMIKTIVLLVFLPLLAGMSLRRYYSNLVDRIQRAIRILSIIIFFGFVVVAIYSNFDNIVNYLYLVFYLVIIHNSLALLMGYWAGTAARLPNSDVRAISIETGIQNSGLALILVFNFFDGLGGMALVAAWWGIWHLVSGFVLAMWWSKRSQRAVITGKSAEIK